jgi:hypothetical protein
MMDACKIDVVALKVHLTSYIDNELKALVTNDGRDSRPTAAPFSAWCSAVAPIAVAYTIKSPTSSLSSSPARSTPVLRLSGPRMGGVSGKCVADA